MNLIIGGAVIFWMVTCAPELFSLFVTIFIMWCLASIFGRWLFGGLPRFIPNHVRKMRGKPYGKWVGQKAAWYAYGRQRERRGVGFGLWHVLLVVTILLSLNTVFVWVDTGVIVLPIILWPAVIILFQLWKMHYQNFPANRPLPRRKRR